MTDQPTGPQGQREQMPKSVFMSDLSGEGDLTWTLDPAVCDETDWVEYRRAPTQEEPVVPDGMVLVSREEWERIHGLAWVVCASVVQRVDYENDGAFRDDVRNLLEIVKESGPRAILGTEGGET